MKKLSSTTSFQFFAYSLGEIATVTGIGKTPWTRGTALGNITPLWNSTSSIERHLDLRGQGHRSRSRSLQRENFGGVFDPLGVIRFQQNLVGTLGITPAIEVLKVAKNRSKGSQWGWGQSFWGTLSLRHFEQNPAFCFLRYYTHICTRQFHTKIESLKRRSMQLLEIRLPKDPPFSGFSRLCQSLAPNDVTAVADTRACYTSLERAQKIE